MTPPELRLWNALRLRPGGFKFRRQHPHGSFVLDFFCSAAALAIEIDGVAHELGDNPRRDLNREALLAASGIATVRFGAIDVRDDIDAVVAAIVQRCKERSPLG